MSGTRVGARGDAAMSEAFAKWDVTEHLRSREDARLYLKACAEEDPGDGRLVRAALIDVARSLGLQVRITA